MYKPSEIDSENKLAGILRCQAYDLEGIISKDVSKMIHESVILCLYDDPNVFTAIKEIKIPKRNFKFGYRKVYSINSELILNSLKSFKFYLNNIYIPQECVHGFIIRRNIATNASYHLNKDTVLNIDIKNFFESIPISGVKQVFKKIGFTEIISSQLSEMTTYKNVLVAGFPTSPVISNIFCEEMDKELMTYCDNRNITYTRYVDDLSFSGNNIDILLDVKNILTKYGFIINELKTKFFKKGQSQYVTGLSVADSSYPRIPKRIKKQIRREIYYICKYGLKSHIAYISGCDEDYVKETEIMSKSANIIGWLHYIAGIEPKFAKRHLDCLYKSDDYTHIKNALSYIKDKRRY